MNYQQNIRSIDVILKVFIYNVTEICLLTLPFLEYSKTNTKKCQESKILLHVFSSLIRKIRPHTF